MRLFWKLFLAVLGGIVGGLVGWRIVSNRRSLPCPPWLAFLLENRWMERVASAEVILARAGVSPGMRLLDVGCGPGRLSIPAAQRVGPLGEVVALDMQPEMLRRARQRAEVAGVDNIHFILGRAGGGLLELGSFDRALLVTVLGEIPNRLETLNEIYLALKPGGLLSITEVLPDPHYQSPNWVRSLGAEAGFDEVGFFSQGLAYTIHFKKSVALV